jgi:hypothetical protein
MKRVLVPGVSLLVLAVALPAFAVSKGKAVYVGGTISGIKEKSENPIELKDETALHYSAGGLTIPWASVQEVEYGQKVGHRIGQAILLTPLVLFKKSRHHYVTLNYKDAAEKDQAVVFEFDKDDIRMVLATVKARTGREIAFTDEEARKQMGGGPSAKEKEEKVPAKQTLATRSPAVKPVVQGSAPPDAAATPIAATPADTAVPPVAAVPPDAERPADKDATKEDSIAQAPKPMTNEDVLKLVAAGIGEEVILTKIRSGSTAFALDTESILQLRKAGVSDAVLSAMLVGTK